MTLQPNKKNLLQTQWALLYSITATVHVITDRVKIN